MKPLLSKATALLGLALLTPYAQAQTAYFTHAVTVDYPTPCTLLDDPTVRIPADTRLHLRLLDGPASTGNRIFGVRYEPRRSVWAICSVDGGAIPAGTVWQVWMGSGFTHITNSDNTHATSSKLPAAAMAPALRRGTQVYITPNLTEPYGLHNHFVRAETIDTEWYLVNNDNTPMRQTLAFNILIVPPPGEQMKPGEQQKSGGYAPNADRPGNDILRLADADMSETWCARLCNQNAQCQAWVLVKDGSQGGVNVCYLKDRVAEARPNPCCNTGVKTASGPTLKNAPTLPGVKAAIPAKAPVGQPQLPGNAAPVNPPDPQGEAANDWRPPPVIP